jgi:hypothetical protein
MRSLDGRVWTFGVGLALAIAGGASGSTFTKVAVLNGGQEVPAVTTGASGCARMVVDTAANTLTYRIAYSGLSGAETAAHFHGPAAIGANGPVVQALPAGNPKVGVWNYPEVSEADILEGRIYINIHSTVNPGGEIRGQVVDMVAVITGDQENPPTGSAATGWGLFQVDRCANELSYHIVFGGLGAAETDAHIHGFALHDANAGVLTALPAGTPKVGTFAYAQADEAVLLAGQTYVNIHSANFPAGEIRGQITRTVAPMDSMQEVPPATKGGHGCGLVAINTAVDGLSFRMNYQNLSGAATAAHIHGYVAAGANGGVQFGIGTANPAKLKWNYPGAQEASILNGLTYFNVHTAAHPGGEIRGQILFPVDPAPCPDTGCDGNVDVTDLVDVILAWATTDPAADVDGNGIVDVADLVAVVLGFGPCP